MASSPPATSRVPVPVALLLAAVLAIAGSCAPSDPAEPPSVRIGAGSTDEQQLLAALTAGLLSRTGTPTEVVPELGDTGGVRDAALQGRVDVLWDYSGAAWTLGLGMAAPATDPQESFEAIAAEDEDNGLLWLGPSGVDAELTLFVQASERPPGPEGTLSWLAGRLGAQESALCADAAYLSAPAGYAYLADTYAIAIDSVAVVVADEAAAIDGVAEGECLAGLATATSGHARARDLRPLIDDQGVFPAFVAAPVVVEGGRADDPVVTAALDQLAGVLDTEVLALLNAAVSEGEPVEEIAAGFLDEAGLGQ